LTLLWLHSLPVCCTCSHKLFTKQHKCNSQVLCRLYIFCCLLQKVPPTTVAPTYKLTLPSEFVLTHMPDMMAGDFGMISADGTQSFTVSIVPRWAELAHCCALTTSTCCAVESGATRNTCCHAGGTRTNLSILCKQRLGSRYELLLHLFGCTCI